MTQNMETDLAEPGRGRLLRGLSDEIAELVKTTGQHVVTVKARRRSPSSGIIWSADGLVVTVDHAIEVEEGITVDLPDGREVPARIVGRDPGSDIALLRVQAGGQAPGELVVSGQTRIGSLVLAVGRPAGARLSASMGIVTAQSGPWRTWRGGLLDSLIQTDVSLYPGFSGGPTVDVDGRILGLNSSLLLKGAAAVVPVETLKRVVQSLATQGRVRRGYLGVSTQPVALPVEMGKQLEISQEAGLLVVGVEPGSPADRGGLILGDVLVSFAGSPVRNGDELQALLGPDRVGASTPVKLLRAGELRALEVTVGERG